MSAFNNNNNDEIKRKPVFLIFAIGLNGEFGFQQKLPWPNLIQDLTHFVTKTTTVLNKNTKNAILMGRKTWESLPNTVKPLKKRVNLVLSRQPIQQAKQVSSIQDALNFVDGMPDIESLFVIGGLDLLYTFITMYASRCQKLYLTQIKGEFLADKYLGLSHFLKVFSQDIPEEHKKYHNELYDLELTTSTFVNPNYIPKHEENQYLDLIQEIISFGSYRDDRTGVGTRALFGKQMKFSLRNGEFPLLTTKQTFFRGVAEELFWMIKGCTNTKLLNEKKVTIWDANGSRTFLDSQGFFNRDEGDLGPVYGFQWRHFGAKYIDCHTDYTGQGFDQLADCIDRIKHNPTDRRIIMSAWNPSDLKLMVLPPCHMFCQFFVDKEELSCLLYQRSCDMGLGVPFNIASYALLTCMIASVCNLKPGDFIHMMGDTHVYLNHIEPLKLQIIRNPYQFPILRLDQSITNIEDFNFSHLKLDNYMFHPKIQMDMAL